MATDLDYDVETDCVVDHSDFDSKPQSGYTDYSSIGVKPRLTSDPLSDFGQLGVQSRRPPANISTGNNSDNLSRSNQDSLETSSVAMGLTSLSFSDKENNDCENVIQRSDNAHVNSELPQTKDFGEVSDSTCTSFSEASHNNPEGNFQDAKRSITQISDDLIQDGAHVVFDWDNTLKLYDSATRQISSRVSREFLLHLKNERHCKLYIISAIRPSKMNLSTLMSEVEKVGLKDVFVGFDSGDSQSDQVDALVEEPVVVKGSEYAHKGNVIICGYDKAETFLKLSSFDAAKGDRVIFFDDEKVNISNFQAIVPGSICYLCE